MKEKRRIDFIANV